MKDDSYVTVHDVMVQNEDLKVKIDETPSLEDVGILNEQLYSGRLSRVPKKYWNRRVVSTGYLMFGKCYIIHVL